MAVTNINNAWKTDLYPLIDRVFDIECKNRLAALSAVVSEEDTKNASFRMEGLGGFGELPEYNGTLENLDQRRGFITTITPQEHAGSIDVDYKYAKVDKSGTARRVGRLAAHTASMKVYTGVLRMFGNAFDESCTGADGCPWASEHHPIAAAGDEEGQSVRDEAAGTYANLVHEELSVAAITAANSRANRFVTPDGMPFLTDYYSGGILLVSPELEGRAREICGPGARICPGQNPDGDTFAANPVWGLRYMVVGGGTVGFRSRQWAIADAALLRECAKIVYITRPTIIRAELDNPLIARIVPYVDFSVGWGDARCIIFSDPQ